jgi:nitrate/nitrite transporter NarK
VALAWAAASHGAAFSGVVAAVPSLVSSPFLVVGGVLADRTHPRATLLWCTASMTVCCAILWALPTELSTRPVVLLASDRAEHEGALA